MSKPPQGPRGPGSPRSNEQARALRTRLSELSAKGLQVDGQKARADEGKQAPDAPQLQRNDNQGKASSPPSSPAAHTGPHRPTFRQRARLYNSASMPDHNRSGVDHIHIKVAEKTGRVMASCGPDRPQPARSGAQAALGPSIGKDGPNKAPSTRQRPAGSYQKLNNASLLEQAKRGRDDTGNSNS